MDAVDAGDDVGVAGTDLHGYMDADADDTDTGIQRVDGDAIRDGDADRGYTCRSTATDL